MAEFLRLASFALVGMFSVWETASTSPVEAAKLYIEKWLDRHNVELYIVDAENGKIVEEVGTENWYKLLFD